ncbi:MAG: hypothetical protein GY852_09775, partial [bacterium]|nr:hypothetical protein [bacterium]
MITELILLVLAIIFFWFALQALGPVALFINSIIALIALKVLGWLGIRIQISIFTVLITVIFGIPGVLILMFLALTGIAFRG